MINQTLPLDLRPALQQNRLLVHPGQTNSRLHFQQGEIMSRISESTWGYALVLVE